MRAVSACFFLSGAASLVLEVVWTRQMRLVFGSTTLAISTVLAAYMLGLGVGGLLGGRFAKRVGNGVRAYGWIEIGIAAYAALVPVLLGALPLVNYALTGALSFWPAALCRFLIALTVLLVPTILMGATLPLLVEALVRRDAEVARRVGYLYGLNTLGAVAGVFGATFVLLPWIGLLRSNLLAAVADAVIGVVALLWLAPRAKEAREAGREAAAAAVSVGREKTWHPAVVAYGLVGFTSLTYEVSWSRALSMILGSSIYAFASMLGAFLTGIALGSLVARRWFDRLERPVTAYGLGVALLGLLALATVVAFRALPTVFVEVVQRFGTTPMGISTAQATISMLAMLAPTLVLGGLFPLLIRAVTRTAAEASAAVGRAYFANTVGSATGAFAAGFVLIPLLGLQLTLAAAVAMNLATAGWLLWWQSEWGGRARSVSVAASVLAAAAVIAVPPGWSPAELSRGVFGALNMQQDVGLDFEPLHDVPANGMIFYREGINTTVSVHRDDGVLGLRVNGKTDASTDVDMQTQVLLGHVGALFAERKPESVLVIGLASGVSVGSAALHQPDTLDVVELEPSMIEASRFFTDFNNRPLEKPFVRVIADDGRNLLANARQRYDLIVSEPSNPWISGASNLFTAEFFAAAHAALRPGGALVQWVQLYAMPAEALRSILAALQAEFPYVTVFEPRPDSGDLILLARDRPLALDALPRWENLAPPVRADLERIGHFSSEDLWSLMLVSADAVRDIATAAAVRNSDDNLYVETHSPWALYDLSIEPGKRVLLSSPHTVDAFFTTPESPSASSLNGLALEYARRGASPAAVALLEAARGAGLDADGELAAVLLRNADGGAKLALLGGIIERHPQAFSPRLERAQMWSEAEDYEASLSDADAALAVRPGDPRAQFLRVRALNALDRASEARVDADALAASPYALFKPEVWLETGLTAAASGDASLAIERLRRYVASQPNEVAGWYALSESYRAAGQEEKARLAAENQSLLVRNAAIAMHIQARRAEHVGRRENAVAYLTEALQFDPSYDPAREDLRRLRGS